MSKCRLDECNYGCQYEGCSYREYKLTCLQKLYVLWRKLTAMRDVLEFYGDEENYNDDGAIRRDVFVEGVDCQELDLGKTAREALSTFPDILAAVEEMYDMAVSCDAHRLCDRSPRIVFRDQLERSKQHVDRMLQALTTEPGEE